MDSEKNVDLPGDSKWPFHPLIGGHLTPWKGSLNHPKKVTLNHQGFEFTWPEIKGENVRDLKVKGMKLGFLAAESPGWYESKGPKPREKTKVTPKLCHGFTIPNRLQKIAR